MRGCCLGKPQAFIRPVPTLIQRIQRGTYSPSNSPTVKISLRFVVGHWSLVISHWSLVIGHWSLVITFLKRSFVELLSDLKYDL